MDGFAAAEAAAAVLSRRTAVLSIVGGVRVMRWLVLGALGVV